MTKRDGEGVELLTLSYDTYTVCICYTHKTEQLSIYPCLSLSDCSLKKDSMTDGSDEVEPQLQLEESQELLIRSLSTEVLGIM